MSGRTLHFYALDALGAVVAFTDKGRRNAWVLLGRGQRRAIEQKEVRRHLVRQEHVVLWDKGAFRSVNKFELGGWK